jgi:hypothetical protein
MEKFVKRCDKVAYYGVPTESGTVYKRMTGFTDITVTKNPKEYKRQYIDQEFEQSDIVGFAPVISFAFDQFSGNEVHDDIMNIANNELVGNDAVREIVMVDFSSDKENPTAIKREFSVVVENEGSGMDGYIVKGSFKVKGEKVFGNAASEDNFATITFSE